MFSIAIDPICEIRRGLAFFILLPGVAVTVGTGTGSLIAELFQKKPWIALFVLMVISVILNLAALVWQVPIYVYSVFWGYFAGPIYDEWIPVTDTLIYERLWAFGLSLFFFSSAVLSGKIRLRIPRNKEIFITAVISLILIFTHGRIAAFDGSYKDLQNRLEGRIITRSVQMDYDKSIPEKDAQWLGQLADFYHDRIRAFLNLRSSRPVKIFVYANDAQKKELMGAGRTNFSKIWNDEIHVNFEDAQDVLRHEMTHVLANDFGKRYYGSLRVGFLEGLAVAAEWHEAFFTPHEWAAALKKRNELPSMVTLLGPAGFFQSYSRMSYIVSGSFTRFLVDTYGIEKFKKVYADGDFEDSYEKPLTALVDEWSGFLDSIPVSAKDARLAQWLTQPGLFQRKCVHYVADIVEAANEQYNAGQYGTASASYSKALAVDPENVRLWLMKLRAEYYVGEWAAMNSEIDSLVSVNKLNYLTAASAQLLRGDALFQMGKTDSAARIYRKIRADYPSVSSVYTAVCLRIQLMSDSTIEDLKKVIGTEDLSEQLKWLKNIAGNSAARYWSAKIHSQKGEYAQAGALLSTFTFDDDVLELARLQLLWESSIREHRADDAIGYLNLGSKIARREMDIEVIRQRTELAFWLLKQKSN
jgi:tetratricopeptide (TPR) repeat protein